MFSISLADFTEEEKAFGIAIENHNKYKKAKRYFLITLCTLPLFFILGIILYTLDPKGYGSSYLILMLISWVGLTVFMGYRTSSLQEKEEHELTYRNTYIRKLVKNNDPTYKYVVRYPYKAKDFLDSKLYVQRLNRLSRHDVIQGKMKGHAFSISQVLAEGKIVKRGIGTFAITPQMDIFHSNFFGLLVRVILPTSVRGSHYFFTRDTNGLRDMDINHRNNLAVHFKAKSTAQVKFQSTDFNNHFVCFSNESNECASRMTAPIQKLLLELEQQLQTPVAGCLYKNRMELHLPMGSENFVIKKGKPVDQETLQSHHIEIVRRLQLIELIINVINAEKSLS